jgi:C1A family cysteine protease
MPKSTGNIKVHLRYVRLFEPDTALHAQLNILLPESLDIIDLTDPTPKVSLIKEDANGADETEVDVYENLPENKGLPTSWDYRTRGIVPAVRDQGSCGGCWSFGTVGVMESAIKKAGGPLTDLSEQFLISCNSSGWDCDGGLTAHKYHYNTLSKNQTQIGAVLESVKPYTATNGTCSVTYNHPYRLSNWTFITGSEWTMPTVTQIKNAIYAYGPITAGVCVGPAFSSYSGGVFSTNETVCNGSTNHQIILVGWDDATSSWILRNSWKSSWGENGYMRIRWNTSRVGEGTSWVTTPGATPPPPSSGFVSTFNSSKAGWVPHPGAPWSVNTAYYYTNGLANKWSSTTYNANFSNFTYEARMSRVNSASTYSVGLLVRGGLPSFDATNRWRNDYQFAYTNSGKFSVFKIIGGSSYAMKSWTSSAAIVRGGWNTLKVVANGSTFKYYINNKLVWIGSDASFKAGRVGVLQYSGPTPERVYVDWAKLSLSVTAVNELIEKEQVEVESSLPQDPRQSP